MTSGIDPFTILALLLVVGLGGFFGLRWMWRGSSGRDVPSPKGRGAGSSGAASSAGGDDSDKDAALAKFRAVHEAARDKRKQLQQAVEKDPDRATRAMRSMMKR